MARLPLDQAYPGISFRPRSRNWLARLMRWPAECVHLEAGHAWMATFIPDTLYLRGKPSPRRDPTRPEVSLCLDCLTGLLEPELAAFPGRVVAFEPDPESFTQYFFVERNDFAAAGLRPEVAGAIEKRVENINGECSDCGAAGQVAVDLAARSVQPRSDRTHRNFARRACFAPGTAPRNYATRSARCTKRICSMSTSRTEMPARTCGFDAFILSPLVEKYLAVAGGFGFLAPIADFGLDRSEAERVFGALDEAHHIRRYLHFSRVAGAETRFNSDFRRHALSGRVCSMLGAACCPRNAGSV